MNNNENTNRKNTISMQEWKNYMFFICDDETKANAVTLLKERDYLLSNGKPNQDEITKEAQFFARSLAERLASSYRAKRFGLQNIADNVNKFSEMQDLSALYFYISNIYGMVFWRVPYNLQRLPVNPKAFDMYMKVYTDTFIESLSQTEPIPDTEEKPEQNYEEEEGLGYDED